MARGKTDVPGIAPIKEKRTVGYYVRGFLKYFVLIFFLSLKNNTHPNKITL